LATLGGADMAAFGRRRNPSTLWSDEATIIRRGVQ